MRKRGRENFVRILKFGSSPFASKTSIQTSYGIKRIKLFVSLPYNKHLQTERSEVCTHGRGQDSSMQTDLARLIKVLSSSTTLGARVFFFLVGVASKNFTYSQNDQLPDGLIAHLVEHRIGITVVKI